MRIAAGIFTVILSVFQWIFLTLLSWWTMLRFTRVSFSFPNIMNVSGDMLAELSKTPWLILMSVSMALICLILIAILNLSRQRMTVLSFAICLLLTGITSLLILRLSIEIRLVLLGCVGCVLLGLVMLLIYVISGMFSKK